MFRAWRLPPEAVLVVLLRVEGAGWRAVAQLGGKAQEAIPAGPWEDLLARAEVEANRGRTASAVLKLAQGLLELVTTGPARTKDEGRTLGIWPYVVVGVGSAAGVVFFIVRRVCPRCLRPLRRRESLGGIMWVCPRCRYTRAPVRWGRRPGGRGGVYP
ncbi:hypothetical protein H5T53_05280 [Candidatus Bipolaricaulota bacterium]|nr:hypothetical protein [Candidatus Bipolaricaulota bacterium]